MDIKIKWIITFLGLCIIIICNSCDKLRIDCANTVYTFQVAGKIYPDKDSIHIGDTIWLELNIPTSFKDVASNKIIDYSGAINLGSSIGFGNYTIINNPVTATNSFLNILVKGNKIDNPNTSQIRSYLFLEENSRYVFKLGIIPIEKGIFGVGFSNAQNVYRNADKCTKAFFNIILESTHQHYYLNPNINKTNTDTTKASGSYYFKVY